MIEAAFAIWCLSVGVAATSVASRHLGVRGTMLVAPLLGAAVYSLAGIVLVPFSAFGTVPALALASLVAAGGIPVVRLVSGRWPPVRTPLLALGIGVVGASIVSAGLQFLHLTRLTPDSIEYLTTAGSLERFGGLAPFGSDILLRRQFTTGSLHAAGVVTGLAYSPTMTFLLTASGIALVAWLGNRALRLFDVPARWRWIIAGSASFFLVTTNRVVYNLFYVNSHGLFAGLLLLGVGFAWYATVSEHEPLLALSALAFAALIPVRADAVAVILIFLVPIITSKALPNRGRWVLVLPLAATTMIWYAVVLRPYLPVAEYRLTGTATANMIIALGLVAIAAAAQIRVLEPVVRWSPWFVVGLLTVFVAWSARHDFSSLIRDLGATGANIGAYGLWGAFWWVAPILVGAAVVAVVVPHQRFLVAGLVTFPVLLVAFAYLRDGPYRVGTGDSANRMLMHVVFVLVFYVITAAGVAYREAFGDDEPPTPSSSNTTAAGSTA